MDSKKFSVVRKNGILPDPNYIDTSSLAEDLWEVYYDSASTGLSNLEAAAIALEAGESPEENAAIIRRILHSLKGDSGVTGLTDIYNLCHEAEFAFEELPGGDATDMILKVKDWITEAIEIIQSNSVVNDEGNSNENHMIKTLVVDDQPVIRKHIELLIHDFCECTFAENGKTAIELFENALTTGEPFELVTLDIEMPVMNGHETLATIRAIEEKNGIFGLDGVKVVMSTTVDNPRDIFSAFNEGCEAYVKKIDMKKKLVEEIKGLGLKTPQAV